jgi:hypothetical protein
MVGGPRAHWRSRFAGGATAWLTNHALATDAAIGQSAHAAREREAVHPRRQSGLDSEGTATLPLSFRHEPLRG